MFCYARPKVRNTASVLSHITIEMITTGCSPSHVRELWKKKNVSKWIIKELVEKLMFLVGTPVQGYIRDSTTGDKIARNRGHARQISLFPVRRRN